MVLVTHAAEAKQITLVKSLSRLSMLQALR